MKDLGGDFILDEKVESILEEEFERLEGQEGR